MKELTKEQFEKLLKEAKSNDVIKVSDLIEMLKPFEDYHLYDPGCYYCAGFYLLNDISARERLKKKSDAIYVCHTIDGKYDDMYRLEEYLERIVPKQKQNDL